MEIQKRYEMLPPWQDETVRSGTAKIRNLKKRTGRCPMTESTPKPVPRTQALGRSPHFRNPASRHRSARKQVRIRTQKQLPGRFSSFYYTYWIERLQKFSSCTENRADSDTHG
jgi:hypothetical protein